MCVAAGSSQITAHTSTSPYARYLSLSLSLSLIPLISALPASICCLEVFEHGVEVVPIFEEVGPVALVEQVPVPWGLALVPRCLRSRRSKHDGVDLRCARYFTGATRSMSRIMNRERRGNVCCCSYHGRPDEVPLLFNALHRGTLFRIVPDVLAPTAIRWHARGAYTPTW